MKMLHLKNIETAIPKIVNTDLPIKYAYLFNVAMSDIELHLGRLHNFKIEFIQKNGQPTEDGGFLIATEKIKEFDEGLEELLQTEIDLNPVELPLSVLMKTNIKLTVLEIEGLKNAGFIVDDINSNED